MANCIIKCQQVRSLTEDMNQNSSNSIKNGKDNNKIRNRHPFLRVRIWKGICQYSSNIIGKSGENVFFIKILLDSIIEKEDKDHVSTVETNV